MRAVIDIWNLKPGEKITVWTKPGYSYKRKRAEHARMLATWKRVEVRIPPDLFARLVALTGRPQGRARPSRADVLLYVVGSGVSALERLHAAAGKRRARKAGAR